MKARQGQNQYLLVRVTAHSKWSQTRQEREESDGGGTTNTVKRLLKGVGEGGGGDSMQEDKRKLNEHE